MAHPTRPNPIPIMGRNHLIHNTFQVTLVPQIPPEEKDTYTVHLKDMVDLFSSDENLEGILYVDTPEKLTTVFMLFSQESQIQNKMRKELKSSPKTSLLILMTQLTLPSIVR